jgi:putative PEP-CTERM system TPR-repeat lipoprotein
MALVCAALLAGCNESPEVMLGSAKEYLAKNDINAASIQLKNALQEDGQLAEARFLLGTVNLEQGDVAGAVKELRRAAELGYAKAEVAPPLARALVLSGQFDEVLSEFGDSTLEDPAARARLLAAVGDAHMAKASLDKAREAYEAAVAANPAEVSARVGLGRAKLFAGDIDAALAEADAAIASKPDAAEAHALRADALIARNRIPEAVAALEAAVKARPTAVMYHFGLVSLLMRENDRDAVTQRLEAMKKVAPKHSLTRYLEAFVAFRENRVAEARDAIMEVNRIAPEFLPAQLLAGSIYLRLNDHLLAQQHLGIVLARAPGQPLARRLLTLSQLASGQSGVALQTLQPLLAATPDDSATMTLAGQVYLANGDFDKASEYFSKVAAAEPEDARARTRLGVSRLLAGDADRAFADLEAASGLDDTVGQPDVALILAHMRRGEFDKALAAQKDLEGKQPDNPQTYTLKGGVLLAKRDVEGARSAFERALVLKGDHLPAAINLARLDVADRRPEDARKRFESIIAANPKNVQAQLLLADLLSRIGAKPEEVQGTLERAISINPGATAPRMVLTQHFLNVREPKKALGVIQELSSAHPNDPQVIAMLARTQRAAGATQQAISSLRKLAGLLPQSPVPLVELSDVQLLSKDRAGAEQSLRRALSLKPDLVEAQRRLITLLREDPKRVEEALAVARTVQKQRPDAPGGFVFEGDIHAASGKWEPAVVAFRKALDRGKAPEIAIALHSAQMRSGKTADAGKTAEAWLQAQPKDVVMRGYLAERALADGRLADAERLYRTMLEYAPDNALILNNLAWVVGQRKDPEAMVLAERALALAPESPAVLDTLGMLQLDQGQRDSGLAKLQKAVSLAPDAGAIRLNLAKAYLKLDRKDDARKELDALLTRAAADSPLHAEAMALKQGM